MSPRTLTALLSLIALPLPVGAQSQPLPIEVLGIRALGSAPVPEGEEWTWVAALRPRPIGVSSAAFHDGTGTGLFSTESEHRLEFRWQFGDHPGHISTGERPMATHAFADDGSYTIRVEAWSRGQLFARGQTDVRVRNEPPRFPRIGAVQLDPATTTVELTAAARDVDADRLQYAWDLNGDGEAERITDQARIEHTFPRPGRYDVRLTVRDDAGGLAEAEHTVTVTGADGVASFDALEEPPADAVRTGIHLRVSGDLEFAFEGRIRPVAGLHLGPRGSSIGGCRFMFSAWDDANLAHLGFIADLEGLLAEGALYRIRSPTVHLLLEPNDRSYRMSERRLTGGGVIGPGGLGGLLTELLPGLDGLRPEVRDIIEDMPPDVRDVIRSGAGVDPRPAEPSEGGPMPAMSPFALDDRESFSVEEGDVGLIFIPYDRATGDLQLQLDNTDGDSPLRTVRLEGEFGMDLEAAQRDGLILYDRCGSAEFTVEEVTPEDDETFVLNPRPDVEVHFSKEYMPHTVELGNFRLTYPGSAGGSDIPVEVELFRRGEMAWIRPVEDLKGGVRYTAWVKTGWDGVLDQGGNAITDEDGDGWYTWSFTTRPDFVPDENSPPGTEGLSCHVFQTVRDAPLIAGKPAVARIYADWRRHPEVDSTAQLEEFTAQVSLLNDWDEMTTTRVRFVRPDLRAARGVEERAAEHTAQLYFDPPADLPSSTRVRVRYPPDPGEDLAGASWTRCSTPVWPYAPRVTVQWFLLDVNEWRDAEIERDVLPWVAPMMEKVGELAQAFYPVSSVQMRYGGVMGWPTGWWWERLGGEHLACDVHCGADLLDYWEENPSDEIAYDPSATISIAILASSTGGGTTPADYEIRDGGPARIAFAVNESVAIRPRLIEGITHEMGHAFWLEHLPYIADGPGAGARRDRIIEARNQAWASNGTLWYEGVEGFLIAPDGTRGWNKSSTEGNEESRHLVPLMFPGTIPFPDVFIARHGYLKIMREIEDRGGLPGGDD